jgi:hypothetical protein
VLLSKKMTIYLIVFLIVLSSFIGYKIHQYNNRFKNLASDITDLIFIWKGLQDVK